MIRVVDDWHLIFLWRELRLDSEVSKADFFPPEIFTVGIKRPSAYQCSWPNFCMLPKSVRVGRQGWQHIGHSSEET